MALSAADREWIKAMARELAYEAIRSVVAEHITACPHGKRINWAKALVIGVGVGVGLASGGAALDLIRALAGL